jgi:hypothetical protein
MTGLLSVSGVSRLSGQKGLTRSLFMSVVDESGKPLAPAEVGDVLIREDNTDRRVVQVKPASQPLSVALLIDTANVENSVQDLRAAVRSFSRELLAKSPEASIALMEFGQAAMPLSGYTQGFAELDKAANLIVSRPNVGSVLLEALGRGNKELSERPSPRRAIVSVNFEPSDEQSREDPKKVQDAFAISGAQLWAVSVQQGSLKAAKRDTVLNKFAQITGGQREFLVGISAVEAQLKTFAGILASQFEVVYERPENAKNVKVVLVGTRPGVKVHASALAPR